VFDSVRQELRYALRGLRASPGFFLVAVATLALGIGSVCAVYSVVDGVLLKPLPYPDAERIFHVERVQEPFGGPVSGPLYSDWREGTAAQFESLAALAGITVNAGGEGEAERLRGYAVTPEFWQVIGLPAQAGRYFGIDEEAGGEKVVVLSHALWQRRYGGDTGIVGSDIVLNNEAYRVVGIAPAAHVFPGDGDVFVPTALPVDSRDRTTSYLSVIGRLRAGVDAQAALAAVERVNVAAIRDNAELYEGLGARIVSMREARVGDVTQPLLVLFAASALVLLIACANLANLLLARGTRRHRELAVRSALGAARSRLLRVVLTEALLVAIVGGGAGVALAAVAVPILLASAPGMLPGQAQIGVDGGVVAISLSISVAVVLLFSLWPAMRAARVAPAAAMQEEGRSGTAGRGRGRARSILVTAEIALSLTLLVGAGLLIESLRQIGRIDTGVRTENVLTVAFVPPVPPGDPTADFTAEYLRRMQALAPRLNAIIDRVSAIPGVTSVGISDALPLSGLDNASSDFDLIGREAASGGVAKVGASWRFASPDFFDAMGMRIVRGRNLSAADQRAGEFPSAVLINETFARRHFADSDPVGTQVSFLGGPKTIVGVVSDARQMGQELQPGVEAYLPHIYSIHAEYFLAMKVQGDPMAYAEQLRQALREIEPQMPVYAMRAMDELAAAGVAMRRFNLQLMSIFSGVALLLAAIGLYGVIAYSVADRRHEFGIRLSLGANGSRLLGLVLRQGMTLVLAGVVIGLIGALALGQALSSQLVGVGSADPAVIGVVVMLLAGIALVACLVPALRASRVDPMVALRSQ
jgi:putative ABC transport system permease protein